MGYLDFFVCFCFLIFWYTILIPNWEILSTHITHRCAHLSYLGNTFQTYSISHLHIKHLTWVDGLCRGLWRSPLLHRCSEDHQDDWCWLEYEQSVFKSRQLAQRHVCFSQLFCSWKNFRKPFPSVFVYCFVFLCFTVSRAADTVCGACLVPVFTALFVVNQSGCSHHYHYSSWCGEPFTPTVYIWWVRLSSTCPGTWDGNKPVARNKAYLLIFKINVSCSCALI